MKVFLMVIQNYQLSVIHRHIQPITQDNIVPSIKEKKTTQDNSNLTFLGLKLGNNKVSPFRAYQFRK